MLHFIKCKRFSSCCPFITPSGGVYPFRTGISAVRIAINDILSKIGTENGLSRNVIKGRGESSNRRRRRRRRRRCYELMEKD
jgi:hypothetical protein